MGILNRKSSLRFGVLRLYFILCCFPNIANADIDLFIMVGQSNMQGYAGNAEKFPCDSFVKDLSIDFYYIQPVSKRQLAEKAEAETQHPSESSTSIIASLGKSWRNFRLRLNRVFECPPPPLPSQEWTFLGPQWKRFPKGHFGPEISFARAMADQGFNPAIFKYSKESTSLAEDWLGPNQNGLYDDFVKHLRSAISKLAGSGEPVRIRGLFWIQGENDAITLENAKLYLDRLNSILRHLRKEVIGDSVPIILGADEAHPSMQMNPQVQAAQQFLADQEECVARSSMLGLQKADSTHLTPAGLVQHGLRLAETHRQLTEKCAHR